MSESLEDPLLDCDKEDHDVSRSDWKIASYWHLLTFKFVNQMMDLGVTKQLNVEDLIPLPCELMPSSCHDTLLCCWIAEENKHYPHLSLLRALCYAYGWPYLCLGLLKVLNDSIGFVGPLLLNKMIKSLQQGSDDVDAYVVAISLGLTSMLKSFLDTQYTFHLSKLKLKLRSSIMTVIYRKCLHINLAERSKFSEGEVQTFMSIDADRTVNMCNSFHDIWSLPLQIGVALYLLYIQVGFAFASGVALTVLLIPVNKWISTLIAKATEKMMKEKDERKYLDAWCVFFWATTPTLFSLLTFGVYTLMGHPLDAATVFTCVALFNTLISPLNSFPWVINGLIDAAISARRLSKFLSCPEPSPELQQNSLRLSKRSDPPAFLFHCQTDVIDDSTAVVFRNASCVWSSSGTEGQNAVLNSIALDLPKGLFIAVVGEVGSGKSSLLYSILGEMRLIQGSLRSHGSVAYVSQVPWILSESVHDNILFGSDLDRIRYEEVIHSCALDVDLSLMTGGDQAYLVEKGTNLSGGQRARLALARAVYFDADIYLLDDVLSAVDSQVACWILEKTILGPLMNQKTRILCTHNIQAISAADMVVVMDKGHAKWAGNSTMSTLKDSLSSPQLLREESNTSAQSELESDILLQGERIAISEVAQDIAGTEVRKEGRVELAVYMSYGTFAGWPIVTLIFASVLFMQASRNGNDLWLSHWVDATTATDNTRFYLAVLCIFSVVNSLLTLVRAFSFSYGGICAAVKVHNELLKKLVNAPVQFFDQNPSGRILNRLSSDMYTIDDSLPFILNILLANFFSLLGAVAVLSYAQIPFLLLLLPLCYLYRKLQFYYRSTSRELRRLDSVSRSPIYSSFTETLNGSVTIRAFKKEELFMRRFTEHVALYQRTSYTELAASLWLSLRLQLLAAFVISFIAVMAVAGCHMTSPISFGTAGLVGLSLSYAVPAVSLLSNYLSSFTETEKEMVSVERVLQFMDIPQEELQGFQSVYPGWPMQGQIEFEHVTVRYMPSLPAALSDVSFNITAGMQVGIVGRTGAGKSSVLNALFRLVPICSGRVLVDGLDIAGISVRYLRGQFAVVPQSPFLFEGSLRHNLDPSGMTADPQIWEALEKCHMKANVEATGGLDVHVKQSGLSFSVGQQQLLCLARALIKSSKVLCLDECTANVDIRTASIIQDTISKECKGMTVLTIAHRISVVLNMDNILVLEHGTLVEQGNPQFLLRDPSSRFSSFAQASAL